MVHEAGVLEETHSNFHHQHPHYIDCDERADGDIVRSGKFKDKRDI